jgi:quercetin dioxygenase-like cupin family protein
MSPAQKRTEVRFMNLWLETDSVNVAVAEWAQLSDLPTQPGLSQLVRKAFVGERMMMMHVFLPEGAAGPRHRHENEQFTVVLQGCLRFRVGEEGNEREFDAKPGQVTHIPSNAWHGVVALEDTMQIDVFAPIRPELLTPPEAGSGY